MIHDALTVCVIMFLEVCNRSLQKCQKPKFDNVHFTEYLTYILYTHYYLPHCIAIVQTVLDGMVNPRLRQFYLLGPSTPSSCLAKSRKSARSRSLIKGIKEIIVIKRDELSTTVVVTFFDPTPVGSTPCNDQDGFSHLQKLQ